MSLAFDEFGRPFIIIREQEKKKRTKGMEAHKVSNKHQISPKSGVGGL
jgi:T-complex protein 1 subunit epsilon